MDTKVNYAVVGSFVITLIIAIVLCIIWLSSGLSVEEYSTYQVNMQEAVTGLGEDAIVEFNGVNVGSVESITLNKTNPQSVELLLNIRQGTPITYGTIATLATRGLTGITYIALKDKGEDLRPLKKEKDEKYPVIKTGPSLLLQLNLGLKKLVDGVNQVSRTFKNLFDQENLLAIKETLINMRSITANLAANNQKLNAILENTAVVSQRLPSVLLSTESALQAFQNQTLPETNRMISNLDGLSAEIRENPSILIRGKQPQALGPGEK